jgi:hypothetical protein
VKTSGIFTVFSIISRLLRYMGQAPTSHMLGLVGWVFDSCPLLSPAIARTRAHGNDGPLILVLCSNHNRETLLQIHMHRILGCCVTHKDHKSKEVPRCCSILHECLGDLGLLAQIPSSSLWIKRSMYLSQTPDLHSWTGLLSLLLACQFEIKTDAHYRRLICW